MTVTAPEFRPGQRIHIPSLPNLRDIGGYATATGGRVRTGQLYRSTELNHLQGDDLERFAELGIRAVFDMRTAAERLAEPDVVPEGTEQVVCDVLKDSQSAAPLRCSRCCRIRRRRAGARRGQGGADVRAGLSGDREPAERAGCLSGVLHRDRARRAPARALSLHDGKDRTGWAAAAMLLLLGVAEEDVLYDYELTNRELLPALKPLLEHFRAAGGDPRLLEPVLGVDADYLRTALDEMTQRFGSIEAYFEEGLGIDSDGQRGLRDTLVAS